MISFIQSAIRLAMTFLLGSTGETITEKSGHLNLGIPGVMCVGAACGCWAEYIYLSAAGANFNAFFIILVPILAALLGGALMGLIFSFLTVSLRANQNVTGLALTTFGIGVADYMIYAISKSSNVFSSVSFASAGPYFTRPLININVSGAAPWIQTLYNIFLSYGVFVYISFAVAIIAYFVLFKTRIGLHLRAVGENPATADAAGINVSRYRYTATCIGSAIAGMGGLSFIMDYLNGNWEYCIDQIGWLAIALVIFTSWKPNWGILGSLVFGALYIASSYIEGVSLAQKELVKMLPFVVTIIVLIITSIRDKKESQPPQSLGLAYFREDR